MTDASSTGPPPPPEGTFDDTTSESTNAPKRPTFDGPPLTMQEEIAAAKAAPEPKPSIETVNAELRDGVNRCPKCGSTDVRPLGADGMLQCQFCRTEWSEQRVEEKYGLGDGIDTLTGTIIAGGARDISSDVTMVTLKCQGCGAEVVIDSAHTVNQRCHWCRQTLSLNTQVPNGAVPDAVLPFRLTKEEAVEKIRAFAANRRLFANRTFKKEFIPENVLGVYLPYLVVDARAESRYWGAGEVQTRRWTQGSGKNQTTYYAADVYQVEREVTFTVDDLTMEAAADRLDFGSHTTNNIINTILPFDTKNAVEWNANYLIGHTSEKRDMDVDAMMPHLEDQLLSIGRSQVRQTLRQFDRGVRWEQEALSLAGSRWVSMYLPVWLYSYRQPGNGMLHYIATNARTGETMGSIPISQPRLVLAALTVGTVFEGLAGFLIAKGMW